MSKLYIGDGVYAQDEGHQIELSTEREGGQIHTIYLDNYTLDELFRFIEVNREVKITVQPVRGAS